MTSSIRVHQLERVAWDILLGSWLFCKQIALTTFRLNARQLALSLILLLEVKGPRPQENQRNICLLFFVTGRNCWNMLCWNNAQLIKLLLKFISFLWKFTFNISILKSRKPEYWNIEPILDPSILEPLVLIWLKSNRKDDTWVLGKSGEMGSPVQWPDWA